jgi:hypothetical protein
MAAQAPATQAPSQTYNDDIPPNRARGEASTKHPVQQAED